ATRWYKRLLENGPIQLLNRAKRNFAFRTHHNAVRIESVVQRKAFPEEFRIGREVYVRAHTPLSQKARDDMSYSAVATDRNGGLHYQRIRAAGHKTLGYFTRRFFDVAGVRLAVGLRRCADSDHNDVRITNRFASIVSKPHPMTHLGQQFVQTLLVNRALAFIQ